MKHISLYNSHSSFAQSAIYKPLPHISMCNSEGEYHYDDYYNYAVHRDINAPVMDIVYAQGWAANSDFMTFEEAAAVTDIGTAFKEKDNIITFDEFQYFTGLTSIPNLAFYYMTNLKTITIPENIRTIGTNGALGRLKRLERITWNTSYVNTPYPAVMYAADHEMTDWEFASDNPFYSIVGGCLYSADKTILYSVPIFKQVTFPQECVSIDKFGLFRNKITSAFVSPSLNYINNAERVFEMSQFTIIDLREANIPIINQTFQSCGANTIILPSNCNDFRGNTFYNASNLTSLILYSTTPPTSVNAITYILNNTPITNGTGYVYVPDASVSAYKADSKWSAIESQIKPISEYVYTATNKQNVLKLADGTNFKFRNGLTVEMDVFVNELTSYRSIIGRYNGYYNIWFNLNRVFSKYNNQQSYTTISDLPLNQKLNFKYVDNIVYLNNEAVITHTTQGEWEDTIDAIFGYFSGGFYYLKIKEGNKLLFDLIPYNVNGSMMMYDRINNVTYS